jgi:predicted RNase H-like HicB family nuclease
MKIALAGYLKHPEKGEKYWPVEIPALGIHTQGKSKKDAYAMAKDAIETIADDKKLELSVVPTGELTFNLEVSSSKELISIILRHLRLSRDRKIVDISKRLGSNSPNAYARYERGEVMPSLDRLTDLIEAIDPDMETILKIG